MIIDKMELENDAKTGFKDKPSTQDEKKFTSFKILFLFANLTELCYCMLDAGNKELMGNRGVSLNSVSLIQPII